MATSFYTVPTTEFASAENYQMHTYNDNSDPKSCIVIFHLGLFPFMGSAFKNQIIEIKGRTLPV